MPFIVNLFKEPRTRFVLILLLALGIRLLGIASRPIWYDEAFSILFAEKGPIAMLHGTVGATGAESAEEHPLGYYVILWLWMNIFGGSIGSVRMLSIFIGIGIVYLTYRISLELFDAKTAETSMLITALMPFQVHYAQEIRMYAFLAMWLLLAVYSYLRGSRSGEWRWWLVFGFSSALAQYTHNLAAFFLIPLAVTPLIQRDWRTFRFVLLSGLFAILLYSPWLIQLPSQLAKVDQSYWVSRPDISSLLTLLLVFTTNTPLPDVWILPALTIAFLIVVIGLIQTTRVKSGNEKSDGLWILFLTFAPPLMLFIFSQWIPVYIERALLPSGAFFCLWLAWILRNADLPRAGRSLMTVMLAVAFGLGIHQHITYRGFPYGPFREMTAYLKENTKPRDKIIHSNKLSLLPAMYFDRGLAQSYIGDPTGSATDTLAPATQEVLGIEAEADIRSAAGEAESIWYVIYQRSIDEYIQAGESTHPDIEFLDSEYRLASHETWDDLLLLHFTKKP